MMFGYLSFRRLQCASPQLDAVGGSPMIRWLLFTIFGLGIAFSSAPALGQGPSFRVLAFYSTKEEPDHVAFAQQALQFFAGAARKDNFDFEATTRWNDLTTASLKQYRAILWLNDFPHTEEQRAAFRQYMDHGGGWLGFHVAAYNDKDSRWPWFVSFLGGAVFYGNNWPPLPARLIVDDRAHPATRRLPANFTSPANEWYIWKPSPRLSKDVKVLVTLDPANFPLGLKDTLTGGDLPVVWTNTKYRMIYMNMGHGDKIFTDADQNSMFEDAVLWLGQKR
jgi:type 1 glutamine amidotransferase